jgi:HAE1 family hydrophobic/amphiphilic exporter-1
VTLAENNLKNLMLKDPLAPEWTHVILPTDNPTFDDAPVSLADALKEARANRQELRRLKLQEEISDIDLQYFKNQTKPRIDLTGTLSTTGLAGTRNVTSSDPAPLIDINDVNRDPAAFLLNEINILRGSPVTVPTVQPQTGTVPPQFVGGYGRTLGNLFSFDTRNVVCGLATEVPFRNRQAEANFVTARNPELRAETDYNKALADLQRATSTTLRANNVIVEAPVDTEFRD